MGREEYRKIKSALLKLKYEEREMTNLLLEEASPNDIDLESIKSALDHLKEFEELEKSESKTFDVILTNLPEKAPGLFGGSSFKKRVKKAVPYLRYLIHVGENFSRPLKPDLKLEETNKMEKIMKEFEEDRKEFLNHIQELKEKDLYLLDKDEQRTLWFRNYDPRLTSLMTYLENFEQIFPEIRFEEEYGKLRGIERIIKRHGPDTFGHFSLSTLLEDLEIVYGVTGRVFEKIGGMYGIKMEKPEMILPKLPEIVSLEERPAEEKIAKEIEEKEELKEPVIGYSIPIEKLMALEIYRLGYKGWLEKTKLGELLPLLKKSGGYIESMGNPENIGSELMALHGLFEKEGTSYDMTLEDIVKFKPEFGRYVDDFRKLITSAVICLEK